MKQDWSQREPERAREREPERAREGAREGARESLSLTILVKEIKLMMFSLDMVDWSVYSLSLST